MDEAKRDSLLCEILQDEKIIAFVERALLASYQSVFADFKKEAKDLILKSFVILRNCSKNGYSNESLIDAVSQISNDVFKKNDPAFWFNWRYAEYKRYLKTKEDFSEIKKYIKGKEVLDFGCGGGYFALYLEKKKYNVHLTDVLDYRAAEARTLPFRRMYSPLDIKYEPQSIDTAIIRTVLHHTEKKHLPVILKKLATISKRVLIKEDVIDLMPRMPGIAAALKKQKLLKEFLHFNEKDRRNILTFFDYFGNVVAQGKPEMNLPFEFKRTKEWIALLNKNNMDVKKVILSGFGKNKLHGNCQVWFVCEVKRK